MRLRSCFRLSKMLVVGLGAGCVGQGPADNGVEAVTKEIQGGRLMGSGGIGYAVKIDQAMSDGKRLICSGAFISPHVVLTAAHCTRNYDYGSVITPTTDTVIRYGKDYASSQKIAGDEKVGWRELGSTDIGLYRVAQAVALAVIPKLYRNCATVNLLGGRIVAYGRMIDGKQAPTPEYYMSAERIVRAIANGVGANGNYVQIDPTTDAGDSGGPWVYSQDRIVAVTHNSAYGSRFCDVAREVETQVKDWGDTLLFVEDSEGGRDGGSLDQGGAAGRGDAASKADGALGGNDSGSADGRAGAGGAAGGSTGGAGASASAATSGSGGAGGALSQTGTAGSSADTGGKGASGNTGGVSGSGGPGSAGRGSGSGGSTERSDGSQGGTRADTQTPAAAGRRTDSGNTSASASSGCGCRTLGDARHGRPSAPLVPCLVFASVLALVGKGNRRRS